MKSFENYQTNYEPTIQEYLKNLRNKRYYLWLKKVKRAVALQANNEIFAMPSTKALMALDYRKLYDYVLFEIHTHFTRACFLKLAKRFELSIEVEILDYELKLIQNRLKGVFSCNSGLALGNDVAEIFAHAYRSALIDITLYFNINLDVMEQPQFGVYEILNPTNKPNFN